MRSAVVVWIYFQGRQLLHGQGRQYLQVQGRQLLQGRQHRINLINQYFVESFILLIGINLSFSIGIQSAYRMAYAPYSNEGCLFE